MRGGGGTCVPCKSRRDIYKWFLVIKLTQNVTLSLPQIFKRHTHTRTPPSIPTLEDRQQITGKYKRHNAKKSSKKEAVGAEEVGEGGVPRRHLHCLASEL